ncbi:DUF742 domain-containing protein [Actinomadura parmotrematis]|uniref:DUF742 domain-containing protein n=1 Tax=Actinomadura parmotrematis TaxID=2864039 RepID=A0ABS7FS26_9ACTN|nr:DUF742 domain-containing protein [Actinomadura parmotrematis]MBW8482775.1 DUF742 domain-containing protein [Actinomadura parmotrematis]
MTTPPFPDPRAPHGPAPRPAAPPAAPSTPQPGSPPAAPGPVPPSWTGGRHRWVRQFVRAGGRVRPPRHLDVHALVAARGFDAGAAARMEPDARALYGAAGRGPATVAELSAATGMSLGLTRIVLGDLFASGHLRHGDTAGAGAADPYDPQMLERLLDGLQRL